MKRKVRFAGLLAVVVGCEASCVMGCAREGARRRSPDEIVVGASRPDEQYASFPVHEAVPVDGLFWNFWADRSDDPPTFEPIETLSKGSSFFLLVDVATFVYGARNAEISAGERLLEVVRTHQKRGSREVHLNLLVIPDATAYDTTPFQHPITIDLEKLGRLTSLHSSGELAPFAARVASVADGQAFAVGRVALPLTLKASAPAAAPVAISVWDGQWGRPLEDLHVELRVGERKAFGTLSRSAGLSGLHALATDSPAPDVAIHFLALSENAPVQGILRTKGAPPDTFIHWSLGEGLWRGTPAEVEDWLVQISTDLGAAMRGSTLSLRGAQLHDLLFRGRGAEALANLMAGVAVVGPPRQTLFVRMLRPGVSAPVALPVAFVRPPSGVRYLGDVYAIETPLAWSTRPPPTPCLTRWTVLQPPGPPAGDSAMQAIRVAIGAEGAAEGRIPGWSPAAELYTDRMLEFRTWFSDASSVSEPSVLVLMSHQGGGRLWFRDNAATPDDVLWVGDLRRRFRSPSVAILAGCETGGPAATALVSRLNRLGISSVIATSTPVNGAALGAFLDLLAEEIEAHPAGETLGHVFEWAVYRFGQTAFEDPELRPRAHQFTLIGDRDVALCRPVRPPSP